MFLIEVFHSSLSFNPLKPSGYFHVPPGLTVKKFYVLSTQCIYLFYVDLRTKIDYFLISNYLILVLITEMKFTARYELDL